VPELYRDRGVLALKLGDGASAEADLGRYLELRPDARDAELMRHVLEQAGDTRLTVN
jgi:regulator of sirC expression with transglutaminase-like and TPR domain